MFNTRDARCTLRITTLTFALAILGPSVLSAQWEADHRLTNDSDTSYTSPSNAWCVGAYGDTVHVVWYDHRDGNNEIYYKRSLDGGVTWGPDTRLTSESNLSYVPSLAVSGSDVHVIWEDDRTQNAEVYHKFSIDGGESWGPDGQVTAMTGPQGTPSLAVVGAYVHVVWVDYSLMGNTEVYYGRSTDGGITWESPIQISNAPLFSTNPSIAAYESNVHIVWQDSRYGWWNHEIYYRHSTDDGITWGVEEQLTYDTTFSFTPSIAVSDSFVHVAWADRRDGNFEMYYKCSTNNGQTWGSDIRLTENSADSYSPSLAASGSCVHMTWQDSRDANDEIYYKRSTDNGITWEPDTRLTDNQSSSQNASVAVAGTRVHVVWQDERDGNWEIYYKRNPNGNTGIDELTNGLASDIYLAATPNPFNHTTIIRYMIQDTGCMILNPRLTIYDATGRTVKSFNLESWIVNRESAFGWDGTDKAHRALGSGVYIVTLEVGDQRTTEKLLLVR